MNILFFILGTIGASIMLAESQLLSPTREYIKKWEKLYYLITCYQCNSFWIGLFFGYFLISNNWCFLLACGCAGSFISVFAVLTLNLIESLTPPKNTCPKCNQSSNSNIPITTNIS